VPTSSPPSPPDRPSQARKNLGTILTLNPDTRPVERFLRLDEAYAIAVAADRVREPQSRPGYRVYWMRHGFFASRDVPATPDGYVIMGRHTSCDVLIDDERSVSLRHVLVRSSSTDDGLPVLSVIDLKSSTGFVLSDGAKPHAITATGPIAFRVGTHAVVAIPSAGRVPSELPTPLVDHEEARGARDRDKPHAVRLQDAKPGFSHDDSPRPSRITMTSPAVDLGARRSTWSDAAPSFAPSPTGEPWAYEIALEPMAGAPRRAIVRLTASDVDHGVLIGRADKCVDDGLRSILNDQVSRVHALILRDRGQCHLYDVASSNGTFDERRNRSRCIALDDDGTSVRLVRVNGVCLHFRSLVKLH